MFKRCAPTECAKLEQANGQGRNKTAKVGRLHGAGIGKCRDHQANRSQLLTADWLPTKWDWVDPLKDANAEIAQIEAGLKSRTQAIAERGYDAEQVDRDIAEEPMRERALGLDFRRPGSPAQGVQALLVENDEADETDDSDERPRQEEQPPETG